MDYTERVRLAVRAAVDRHLIPADERRQRSAIRKRMAEAGVEVSVQAVGNVLTGKHDFKAEKNSAMAAALRVSSDWLANERGSMEIDDNTKDGRNSHGSLMDGRSSPSFTLLPVVEYTRLNMSAQNDSLKAVEFDWFTVPGEYSQAAKVTQMPDNSMFPDIWPGEYIAFDTGIAPDTGDTVLVRDPEGKLWIRKYKAFPKGQFEASPLNPDHSVLSSSEHQVKVVAVLVGHMRGRRPLRH